VSEILGEAFRDKFTRLSRVAPERITTLLRESGDSPRPPIQGLPGGRAEWSGRRRDDAQVEGAEENSPRTRHQGVHKLVGEEEAEGRVDDPVPYTEGGKCYVEYVAVASTARGMMVGTNLIREGMTIAADTGLRRFTLYVAGGNQEAIRVYEKAGLRRIRSVGSRLTDRFFAVREWHFMEARFE